MSAPPSEATAQAEVAVANSTVVPLVSAPIQEAINTELTPLNADDVVANRGPEKVAIVTGASSGIGRASAISLSLDGWKLVLFGRREEELQNTAKKCRWETLVVPGDVSKEEDVRVLFEKCIETFGKLDLLFNNAGVSGKHLPIEELSIEDFLEVLNVNTLGSYLCAREAIKIFKKQGNGGRIINNGSIAAHSPRPDHVAYTVSKHAVTGLTKSIALEGRLHNIACTQIDIGNAVTEMSAGSGGQSGEPMMDVQHVADTIVHIASLPPSVTMLMVNIMATEMPFVGRG